MTAAAHEAVTVTINLNVVADKGMVRVRHGHELIGHWTPERGWESDHLEGKTLVHFSSKELFAAIVRVWSQANEKKERDVEKKTEE